METQDPAGGRYRMFRGHVFEQLPDGRLVDPFLMRIIRHHADTEDHRAELLEMCSVSGTRIEHLNILLRHIGSRRPLEMDSFSVSIWQVDRMVAITCKFRSGIFQWGEGVLSGTRDMFPDVVLATLRGRPLADLITHPYFPPDVTIGGVIHDAGMRWHATITAMDRPRTRKAKKA